MSQLSPAVLQILQTAVAAHQQGRFVDAEAGYRKVLKKEPRQFDALHLLGVARLAQGHAEEAIEWIAKAVKIMPQNPQAQANLAQAWFVRGNILAMQGGQFLAALPCFEKALAIRGNFPEAMNNLGLCLDELGRLDEALNYYEQLVNLAPNYPDGWYNRGNVLQRRGVFEQALLSLQRALQLRPDYMEAWYALGNTLLALFRWDEAKTCYENALQLNPGFPDALNNLANVLIDLKQPDEALKRFKELQQIAPNFPIVDGSILHAALQGCDWSIYTEQSALVRNKLAHKQLVTHPFWWLAATDSLDDHLACARLYVDAHCPPHLPLWTGEKYQHEKIRIAYLSADFHNHATAFLMAELFECHNKDKFEVIAISFGPDVEDEMRIRLRKAFDRFECVKEKTDLEIAQLIRELEVDIAVDLKGYTQDARPGIFSYRPAPLQISYIGYPGTMAAPYMDYIIADEVIIPAELEEFYTEKIIRMPDTYQVNDSSRVIADDTPTRASQLLPESAFVFCCFNNNYKITPSVFSCWMNILAKVENSVLWLLEDNAVARNNLCKAASERGINPERLIFAPRMALPEHLARHRLADLFLDTLPYNAHTTASDALWAGLPVITCMGQSFAGRVAASLLTAGELPELITHNVEDYEALACRLAASPEELSGYRSRLAQKRDSCALFDAVKFCRHLENAYQNIHQRYQQDFAPQSFTAKTLGKDKS